MSRNRISNPPSAVRYDMPLLKDDSRIGNVADHVERKAYEQGFKSGEQAGMDMGLQKAAVVLDRLETVLKEITALRENLAARMESECVELAVAMARKIVIEEFKLQPESQVAIVREALTKIERSGRITIKIHPSLKDLFQQHKAQLLSLHADIAFAPDPSLSPYGAVVTGPTEEVVTDVDEQIKNLIKHMVALHGLP